MQCHRQGCRNIHMTKKELKKWITYASPSKNSEDKISKISHNIWGGEMWGAFGKQK